MSYQNFGDHDSRMETMREEKEQESSFWKYIAVMAGVSAASLMAISVSGMGLKPTIISNLELARRGTIFYTSLSSTEMSTLFDEFILLYGRDVSISFDNDAFAYDKILCLLLY